MLSLLIMGTITYLNYARQSSQIRSEGIRSVNLLTDSVFTGMLHPMSVGDSETIQKQMEDFYHRMKGVDVYIFDFDKSVIYASKPETTGRQLNQLVHSSELRQVLDQLLTSGRIDQNGFEEMISQVQHLTVLRPILNEKRCFHCHGSSRSVLGGMLVRKNVSEIYAALGTLRNENLLTGLAGLLGTVFVLYLLITRMVIQPVRKVTLHLNEAADHVFQASDQVSSASHMLARGAGEQTESVEGASSSLNEMSSIIDKSSEHAAKVKDLMWETGKIVTRVGKHMKQMHQAMDDITRSSEETGKIIRTIDEIAFKTNLLSLNAAVEAARAGEAGAGFAVVANEVRSLALQAAKAAKNTSELIDHTVESVKKGYELTQSTQDAFQANVEITNTVGHLSEDIAEATSEQNRRMKVVNTTVEEMHQGLQVTLEKAEQSASASELMTSESDNLKSLVDQLMALVEGNALQDQKNPSGLIAHQKDCH
jgi:Methyl-accepting chemotaxis protein (MCP) signalling domain